MPWISGLFSAPARARLEERQGREPTVMPFFDGLMAGEPDALVESFAGEPEVYHPVRGRIKGRRAFAAYVAETNAWLRRHNVWVEAVDVVSAERSGFEEVVLHLDGETGGVDLPVAIVADRRSDRRVTELRIYFSSWPLTGRHMNRQPLLQPDPDLRPPDVVAEFGRALAAGDLEAILATFEPDGRVREPAGGQYLHSGPDGLRGFFEPLFTIGGGIPLEICGLVDDGRACAVEYNVVGWGRMEMAPQAAMGVFVRGESGSLANVRLYDDVHRSLGQHMQGRESASGGG